MPYPYSNLEINCISIDKNRIGSGYTITLSHEIFDGVLPDDTIPSVKVDLFSYLYRQNCHNAIRSDLRALAGIKHTLLPRARYAIPGLPGR